MNVTALEEYGLRCAVRLATLSPDETLSASQVAELEGLSVEYVSKFMLYLRRAEIVRTVRGAHGGFALAKPATEISLKEVFEALGGKRRMGDEFCQSYAGKEHSCVRTDGCTIRPFWKILASYVDQFTSELKLSDLIANEAMTLEKTETIAKNNAKNLRTFKAEAIAAAKETV